MSDSLTDDTCFLCGCNARSGSYNRGHGKVFIECTNEACGEYLITNSAMRRFTNGESKKELSKMATSREEIQHGGEILVIYYYDGAIRAKFKRLEDALHNAEINSFGFRRRDS